MEWIPELKLGRPNGRLPLALYALVLAGTILSQPHEVQAKLFDTAGWTAK
jgi:hypothetical protein